MIIWKGWGFLVAVFTFGASLAMELITESIAGDDTFYQNEAWPLALALVLAGVLTWFVGRKLQARGAHTFFFIPMHYWGVALIALAVLPFVLRR
jgi:hypothetical protein